MHLNKLGTQQAWLHISTNREKNIYWPKMQFFCHFWAKNDHFQDKKPIFQLVLEQFHRISALQITGYSSSMSLYVGIPKQIMFGLKIPFFYHFQSKKAQFRGVLGLVCGLWSIFCRKNPYFIYSYVNKDIGMVRCEKNNIFKIGDFVSASFTLTDT